MFTINDRTAEGFAKWMQSSLDDNYFTMDAPELAQKELHYVFVYGTLKSGFSRNSVLSNGGGKAIGPAMTVNDTYVMRRTKGKYTYPVMLPSVAANRGHIQGEVWAVPPQAIHEMDFIESNGQMYDRSKIAVEVLLGPQRKPYKLLAWCYIGNPGYWYSTANHKANPLLDCDILVRNKDQNFQYYTFMRKYVLEATAA